MLRTAFTRSAVVSRTSTGRCFASGGDQGILDSIKEKAGQVTEKVSKAFESDGKVGAKFEKDRSTGHEGSVAETAEKNVGGDFSGEGKVGKEFKSDGKVGGKVEDLAEKGKEKGQELKHDARS